jgi:dTDP-4-amino-4,6-dideoxygalactose transaminase
MLGTISKDISESSILKVNNVPYSAIRFEPEFISRWMFRVEDLTCRTQFVNSDFIQTFEARLAKCAETKEAIVCGNGTDALQIALRAIGIGPGDIVLIPDSTFWATFEAVCNVGARPVTVDIDLNDLHLSAELLLKAIQQFTPKAVILVHLYGWVAKDTKLIRDLCNQYGIYLIEDSAQAWGATIDGQSIFSGALISTTSFYPGKVLGGAGDGGAIFTNDSKLAEQIRLLKNHGRLGKYNHHLVGWNSRLDVLQCAYIDLCLDYIKTRISSRKFATDWYRSNIKNNYLNVKSPALNVCENGYISVALVNQDYRIKLIKGLTEAKIGYDVIYPAPISEQPGAKQWIAGRLTYGNTTNICSSIINLPCFAGIQQDELNYVKYHLDVILNEEN